MHEAGHAEHFSHVEPSLPVEHRYLGDNSVTEGFAFLFQHLTEDPAWLERRLGVEDPEPVVEQARASKLVFLRRYCAKLAYELELQGEAATSTGSDELYARRLSEAVHVTGRGRPGSATWTRSSTRPRYLRAWALETHLRRELRERFGELLVRGAGARASCCATLWSAGQRAARATSCWRRLTGAELDFCARCCD